VVVGDRVRTRWSRRRFACYVFGCVHSASHAERCWLERHGEILRRAAALADEGELKPLVNSERFTTSDLDAAYAAVEWGPTGKVVVEIAETKRPPS
jgi:NADPH:quinone reductase-like Zn-dependent oxidoreductase